MTSKLFTADAMLKIRLENNSVLTALSRPLLVSVKVNCKVEAVTPEKKAEKVVIFR